LTKEKRKKEKLLDSACYYEKVTEENSLQNTNVRFAKVLSSFVQIGTLSFSFKYLDIQMGGRILVDIKSKFSWTKWVNFREFSFPEFWWTLLSTRIPLFG
jgi:hypothetical protein